MWTAVYLLTWVKESRRDGYYPSSALVLTVHLFTFTTWQYLFLALFSVELVQCNHQLRMDVYTRPELTDMITCYGAAGGNGRTLRMYQERCIRMNVTLVYPMYPPLFAFQTEHSLEASWLLTLLVWARRWGEHCFISGSHLWTCVYKDWGPTTPHLVFDLSSDFWNGASRIPPFLHKSCFLMRPASQEMATSTAERATSGTTRIRTQCSSEFTRRDST